jgi:hypothetical protein
MPNRSNDLEARESEARSAAAPPQIPLDLLPPPSLSQPLWRSLVGNLRDRFAPEKLPPLELTSRPVNLGLSHGDRLRLPWYRTVFSKLGDVISPETLPPLELESLTDQLSHFWWGSLLRNLADRVAPESQPSLKLTAKPILDVIPKSWMLLPMWSEVVDTPKVFYPDKPKAPESVRPARPRPVALPAEKLEALVGEPTTADLLRDLRRSRIRQRIWIGLAAAQVLYMVAMALGKL